MSSCTVIADGSYKVVATVQAGNGLTADGHEFALTPPGTALITAYHAVPYDLVMTTGSGSLSIVGSLPCPSGLNW